MLDIDQPLITATQTWLKTIIIEYSLCPFAKRELDKGSIYFSVIRETDIERCLLDLLTECDRLNTDDSIETSLLIYADAFGDFDEHLLFLEPRALFPQDIEEGLTIEGSALPQGTHPDAPRNVLYTVTEIYPEHAVLDGNHPLSGIALRLSLKVASVREPTEAEVDSGSCGTGFFKIEVGDEGLPTGPTLH